MTAPFPASLAEHYVPGAKLGANVNPLSGYRLNSAGVWVNQADRAFDPHTRIHQGKMFSMGASDAALADNAHLDIVLTPAAGNYPHVDFTAVLGGEGQVRVYRAPESTGGTPIVPVNFKTYSSATLDAEVLTAATITEVGTLLYTSRIPGGAGGQARGTFSEFDFEFMLEAEVSFLFRLTNESGQARKALLTLYAYNAPAYADEE